MVKRIQKEKHHNTVRTLQNDYFRLSDSQAKLSKKQKILLRRRLIAFSIIASIILTFLISAIWNQNQRLANKQKEKEVVLAELKKVKNQQKSLNLQITKLEDDEYIAKLARKEYFLSDNGEIIFTIPEEPKTNTKKQ